MKEEQGHNRSSRGYIATIWRQKQQEDRSSDEETAGTAGRQDRTGGDRSIRKTEAAGKRQEHA